MSAFPPDERSTAAVRALAAGRMVAGLVPGEERPSDFKLTARTRLGRIAQLTRYVARWGARAESRWVSRLAQLRLGRGRFARKARRERVRGPSATVRRIRQRRGSGTQPKRRPTGGERISRTDRATLLRSEGRAVSGRQWRQLRKAARRQERAS